MQHATEKLSNENLVGGKLKPELNFFSPLEHVTELIVLAKRILSVALDNFGVDGKTPPKSMKLPTNRFSIISLQLKCQYVVSFLPDYAPTPSNRAFVFKKMQHRKLQGEHCILVTNCRPKIQSVDCREYQKYIPALKDVIKQIDINIAPSSDEKNLLVITMLIDFCFQFKESNIFLFRVRVQGLQGFC